MTTYINDEDLKQLKGTKFKATLKLEDVIGRSKRVDCIMHQNGRCLLVSYPFTGKFIYDEVEGSYYPQVWQNITVNGSKESMYIKVPVNKLFHSSISAINQTLLCWFFDKNVATRIVSDLQDPNSVASSFFNTYYARFQNNSDEKNKE